MASQLIQHNMILLSKDDQKVSIDKGELVGYAVGGHEYIHQKGSPGWRNSDTEMFPIIGPADVADFNVKTPRGMAIQDQHGLLRELEYELVGHSKQHAVFQKKYVANTPVQNSKFPDKSLVNELLWPYSFTFVKQLELYEDGLKITFKIAGEPGMPFMLGYHPAFKLQIRQPIVETGGRSIELAEVMEVGSRALHVENCETLILNDAKRLKIKTQGFGNFMLWTGVPNMICIEPITFYPYNVEQRELHEGFQFLDLPEAEFVVQIIPL